MRVLLADEDPPRDPGLRSSIEALGHTVVGGAGGPRRLSLLARRARVRVAVIASPAPLEIARRIHAARPLPLILVRGPGPQPEGLAGARIPVYACLASPVAADSLSSVLELACARHEEARRLERRVEELRGQLAGRSSIERAKAILMEARGLDESEAYRIPRSESQNRRRTLAEVAGTVVAMEGVIGRCGGAG